MHRRALSVLLAAGCLLTQVSITTSHLPQVGALSAAAQVQATSLADKIGAQHVVGFTGCAASGCPEPAAVANLAKSAGLKRAVEDFSWADMEPAQGQYRFYNHDNIVNSAVAAGLSVTADLTYTPKFYSPRPDAPNYALFPPTSPQALDAWERFVRAVVGRYKDRVHDWLIWPNMDDREFWVPDPSIPEPAWVPQYLAVLQRAYTAIKSIDPTATVNTAGMDPLFLNALLDQGGASYFDAVGVHNYANPDIPEESKLLTLRLASLQDVLDRRAPTKRLAVTEYAWPSAPGSATGVTEEEQASYLIRSLLLQSTWPTLDRITWTDFQDQASGTYTTDDPNDNLGMLLKWQPGPTTNPPKKLAYNAFTALTTALGDARFVSAKLAPPASSQLFESFEGAQEYILYASPDASGSYTKSNANPHNGSFSGQISYRRSAGAGSGVEIAPLPKNYLDVPGAPTRIRVWARGDGGPAPLLLVKIQDATGELFNVSMGLVSGTDWREYVYYLDAPQSKSGLWSGGGGNNDKVVDYPVKFVSIGLAGWTAATPATSGTVWVDDLTFETGPTIFDYTYQGSNGTIHALWSLTGNPTISIPTTDASATVRDWTNTATTVAAAGGQITVAAGPHPSFVTLTGAAAQPQTFADVAPSYWAFSPIEGLYARGVTTGCATGPPRYCPDDVVNRDQMAVFLVRAKHGQSFTPPPAAGNVFADVPAGYWAAAYVEQAYRDGITTGCATGPPRYCPSSPVTRDQMAAFLERAKHGGDYTPPAATGKVFGDVAAGAFAAAFIEALFNEQITTGCVQGTSSANRYYCPGSTVTRSQMATFLMRTFFP